MEQKFSDTFIEGVCNAVFSGLVFAYRDTHLASEYLNKYHKNLVIFEPGFVDSSSKGGGLSSNLRYLIASSQNKTMPSLFQDNGHCTIRNGSYFKVLDVFNVAEKVQITLLHIPTDTVEFFSSYNINLEDIIIEKARENFSSMIQLEPIAELMSDDWLERVEAPLGMDDKGEFFAQFRE